jgi:hypothetical protein
MKRRASFVGVNEGEGVMDDDEIKLAAAYGIASLTMQMALMNALAGQGGVPAEQINRLIALAREAVDLTSAPEFSREIKELAMAAIDRVGANWQTMHVRH